MKAIRVAKYGEPEVMQLQEVADPKPGSGQVVVKIRAVGVNPVETYMRSGGYMQNPRLPYTPGTDGAGVVEALGVGVKRFRAGERVYTSGSLSGTYAEKALCAESQVHPLPERASFAKGAALGISYATAWRALFQRGQAQPGETVLVHGASGGVGTAAVQLASAAGMTVIGTAGTQEGRRLVAELGAIHVLDHTQSGYLAQVIMLTGDRGVDLILEMLANVNLSQDLGVLATFGRVVVVGSRGTVEIDPRDLMRTEGTILGVRLPNASAKELESIHAALRAGLTAGTVRPVISKELPLAEAARAHHEIIEEKAHGKIVLVP
jgi:NADPH2:quinone reductase